MIILCFIILEIISVLSYLIIALYHFLIFRFRGVWSLYVYTEPGSSDKTYRTNMRNFFHLHLLFFFFSFFVHLFRDYFIFPYQ